jgi:hypothetical protein
VPREMSEGIFDVRPCCQNGETRLVVDRIAAARYILDGGPGTYLLPDILSGTLTRAGLLSCFPGTLSRYRRLLTGRGYCPRAELVTCILWSVVRKANYWSGRRDLNPRLRPWQGRTLPLSYSRPATLIINNQSFRSNGANFS